MDSATAEAVQAEVMAPARKGGEIAEARQVPPPAAAIPQIDPVIERLISDPTIDLERVKTILALRKEMADEDARQKKEAADAVSLNAFNNAFLECQKKIPIVIRDEENKETHSQYATLARIGEAIDQIVSGNGFTLSFYPVPTQRDGFVKLECILVHVPGGHERRFPAEIPVDNVGQKGGSTKTAVHGWRSSITFMRRTVYELIFNVKSRKATPDDDGNAAGRVTPITDEQVAEIRLMIAGTKSNEAKFLETYKVERLEDLLLKQFEQARGLLMQRAANMAKKAAEEAANAG